MDTNRPGVPFTDDPEHPQTPGRTRALEGVVTVLLFKAGLIWLLPLIVNYLLTGKATR